MVDYVFFYKLTVRSLMIYKFKSIINTHSVPLISKLVLFFSLINIEDLHMVQGYNYAYLFRFFLGRKTYLSRQKSFFNLGKWTYSFNICCSIKGKFVYDELFFLANDVLPKVEKFYFKSGIFSRDLKIFYIILKDLNFFSEQKTNLGLFYLDNNLNFHLFYDKINNVNNVRNFLSNLKLNIY